MQVGAVGERRRAHDVGEVRTLRVDGVVLPVGLEQAAVGGEVAPVGGEAIGAPEDGEEIGEQINEHYATGISIISIS